MPLLSIQEIEDLSANRDVIVTEECSTRVMCIWERASCAHFNKFYDAYSDNRQKNNFDQARLNLSLAINEFMQVNDTALYYNYDLIQVINRIAHDLKQANNYVKDNINSVSSLNTDITIMRHALISSNGKYLDETIHLTEQATIIHDEKTFKEKCYKFSKEHPYVVATGGVVIGIAIGTTIFYLGPAALIKLSLAEGSKWIGFTKATGITIGAIVATGSCVVAYKADTWLKNIQDKKLFAANSLTLRRQIADLEKEKQDQMKLQNEEDNQQQDAQLTIA